MIQIVQARPKKRTKSMIRVGETQGDASRVGDDGEGAGCGCGGGTGRGVTLIGANGGMWFGTWMAYGPLTVLRVTV